MVKDKYHIPKISSNQREVVIYGRKRHRSFELVSDPRIL